MSTNDGWGTRSRWLLLLGGVLLLVLGWVGGRMSAGAGPFGMMGGGMHGMRMGHGDHGPKEASHGAASPGGETTGSGEFDGDTGLKRCRAMMGTMTGMHRSMQSMMGDGGTESEGSDRRGHMGGMMNGTDGHGMRGEGGMHERRRSMHGPMMGNEGDLSPEQMRRLCRTMHASMRAAMHGSGTDSSGAAAENALAGASVSDDTKTWMQSARGVESIEDRTGQDEVVVEVGAGDGLQYAPAAVRVDPGTTVRWRWTGQGGLHDVAFTNAEIGTPLKDEAGATFSYTFTETGEYRYECTPHSGVGMRGAVIVAENEG